jgi:type IV pilus assembly protein PilA
MFCSQCGSQNVDGAQFCGKCGMVLGSGPGSTVSGVSGAPGGMQAIGGEPPRRSGMALASLIFGLFFFVFPASIAAIVFGHLSLSEIRKSAGRITGHGLAMAGLILGYIGVAIIPFILIVAAIAIPNLLRAKTAANEASAVGSLRTIVAANETYGSEFGNGFARSLAQLDGAGSGAGNCEHAGLVDSALASGQRHGYIFSYSAKPSSNPPAKGCAEPGASGFSVNADPVTRGTTGMRSFYADESGVIRIERSGPASADSEILP